MCLPLPVRALQVGLVQFRNFTLADNGAGPLQHIVNGKDNGAGMEMTWVRDDRSRVDVPLSNMAGLHGALIIARTAQGRTGTAGVWPRPDRRVSGVITQSQPEFEAKHTALMALVNVTFVGYETGTQFTVLEACGKVCWPGLAPLGALVLIGLTGLQA